MKKSIATIFLASLFITASCLLVDCNNNSSSAADAAKKDSLAKRVARGNYLANHVANCMDCHSQRDYDLFTGPVKPGTEGMGGFAFDSKVGIPGVVYARNITADTATGIGSWSDADIVKAITQGISKNGDTLFPLMPYPHFNGMSREDINDIVAYIRTLKPIYNKVPQRNLFIPISAAYPPMLKVSVDSNTRPDYADKIHYGGYLVNAAGCMDCHTPQERGEFQMNKLFAGGFLFDVGAFKVQSANLTPDSATGIGTWSEETFLHKFQHFRDPANYNFKPGKNNSIMPWTLFAGMDDYDIKAVYAYLRTLTAIKNPVVKYPQ